MVRLEVDLETILGTLGVRQRYNLDGMAVYCSASCLQTHHAYSLGADPPILDGGRKLENPEETYTVTNRQTVTGTKDRTREL